jgi:hypothetical protein
MSSDDRRISAWRAQAVVRIAELRHEMHLVGGCLNTPIAGDHRAAAAVGGRSELCLTFIGERLDAAESAATRMQRRTRLAVGLTGRDVETVWRNIHAAEAELLRVIPATDAGTGHDLAGQSAEIDSTVEMYLPATDSRRIELHRRYVTDKTLTDKDREPAARAIRAALREYDDQRSRVRSFRNVLLVVSAVMMGAVAAIAVATAARPTVLSLCFGASCPTGNDTPTSFDVILVELLGAAAALLIGAMSLARVRGTATPYAVPVVAALFKVPTGALTAVFGLLLIRGQFAPGITLTSTPEIVAWALLFGAAQQSFTMLIDRQAQTVLNNVKSTDQSQSN